MQIIERIFRKIYALPCWNVEWDRNLNLSMMFGEPYLVIEEPRSVKTPDESVRRLFSWRRVSIRGKWMLWIVNAYWSLSLSDFERVTGASAYRKKHMAVRRLDGQKLTQVTVDPQNATTQFVFDLGGTLRVRRFGPDNQGDVWTLYTPYGRVLAVRGDGYFSYDAGTTKPENVNWKSLTDGAQDRC